MVQALAQPAAWRADALVGPRFTMSVNVSALQLSDALGELIQLECEANGLEGRDVVVELTETAVARGRSAPPPVRRRGHRGPPASGKPPGVVLRRRPGLLLVEAAPASRPSSHCHLVVAQWVLAFTRILRPQDAHQTWENI